jgi:hypothetical protein
LLAMLHARGASNGGRTSEIHHDSMWRETLYTGRLLYELEYRLRDAYCERVAVSNRCDSLRVDDYCEYLYSQTDGKAMHHQGKAGTRGKSRDSGIGTPKHRCIHHSYPLRSKSVTLDAVSIDQVTLGEFECMIQDTLEIF